MGSFKLMGALSWMSHHAETIGGRPVAAHSSGNFASGISFAGRAFGKHVVVSADECVKAGACAHTRAHARTRTHVRAK